MLRIHKRTGEDPGNQRFNLNKEITLYRLLIDLSRSAKNHGRGEHEVARIAPIMGSHRTRRDDIRRQGISGSG